MPTLTSTWPAAPVTDLSRSSRAGEPFGIAVALFLLYLFLVTSRVLEYTIQIPKLMFIIGFSTVLVVTITALSLNRLAGRDGFLLAAFTIIAMLSSPFAYWRMASVMGLYAWLANLAVFMAGAQVLATPRLIRRSLVVIAMATLSLAIVAARSPEQGHGRLSMEGSYGNANDLAIVLLFGLPCWGLIYGSGWGGFPRKALAATVIAFHIWLVLRTGSRGGLLALLAILTIAWLRVSIAKKIVSMGLAGLLGLTAVAYLPESTRDRYRSWSPGPDAEGESSEAAQSAQLRYRILQQGIKVSLQHPLLGVGMGNFMYAANDEFEKAGQRPVWKGAHNSFLQVSSELGFPALLIYCALLVHSGRASYRLARKGPLEQQPLGWCVLAMTISFVVASFFLSMTYNAFVPTLAVLATAFDRLPAPSIDAGTRAGSSQRAPLA
jgi:O-antigen ligase